jgi:4-hydroxymandelate oxidase
MKQHRTISRRLFSKFLAASPLLAYSVGLDAFAQDGLDPDLRYILSQTRDLVASPDQAMNVFDLEAVARNKLPPAHYGYIATGVEGELTQIANREAYKHIQLRVRRLTDASHIDMGGDLFGVKWTSPIFLSPAGSQKAFDPDGEIAVAKAACSRRHIQVLSASSSVSLEDVNDARGEPVWFDTFLIEDWSFAYSIIKRAEKAGCPVLVVTVDYTTDQDRETRQTFALKDNRNCGTCHGPAFKSKYDPIPKIYLPNYTGIEQRKAGGETIPSTWDMIDRIRNQTKMTVVLKGILTAEDASSCVKHGMDGIIVSNHGGRADPTGLGTIESLPEVISAVAGKMPVMVDGGIRRGADIFKALALGAIAVGIGRPYLWGLGAFGQSGVERVLDILRAELSLVMKQAGAPSIARITPDFLIRR